MKSDNYEISIKVNKFTKIFSKILHFSEIMVIIFEDPQILDGNKDL
jgi:hypothetical protein